MKKKNSYTILKRQYYLFVFKNQRAQVRAILFVKFTGEEAEEIIVLQNQVKGHSHIAREIYKIYIDHD